MTAVLRASAPSSRRAARASAIVTWVYAAGFGVPTVPVAIYLMKTASLRSFFGLFDMCGGVVTPVRRRHICCAAD